jgi:hypothetical protein
MQFRLSKREDINLDIFLEKPDKVNTLLRTKMNTSTGVK